MNLPVFPPLIIGLNRCHIKWNEHVWKYNRMLCFCSTGIFWSCWCLPRATEDDWRLLRHWRNPNLQTRSCCKISGKPHPLLRKSHLIIWSNFPFKSARLCLWQKQVTKRKWRNNNALSVCDELHFMLSVPHFHFYKSSTALALPYIDILIGWWFRTLNIMPVYSLYTQFVSFMKIIVTYEKGLEVSVMFISGTL